MRDALLERSQGFVILQIADVVTKEGIILACDTEGVFKFCARRQNRRLLAIRGDADLERSC